MKYKYSTTAQAVGFSGKFVKRPIVTIKLKNGKSELKASALIDSGADNIVLNEGFANILGIDLDSCEEVKITGIEGRPQSTKVCDIEYSIEHLNEKIKTKVAFIKSDSVGVLLGQEGLFDKYKIIFDHKKSIFEIKNNK
jgi:predicted aspartyl protease